MGIDIGAKVEIYRLIGELTEQGAGIFILSTDLLELLGICDRILVMFRGRVVREFSPAATNSDEFASLRDRRRCHESPGKTLEDYIDSDLFGANPEYRPPPINSSATGSASAGWFADRAGSRDDFIFRSLQRELHKFRQCRQRPGTICNSRCPIIRDDHRDDQRWLERNHRGDRFIIGK